MIKQNQLSKEVFILSEDRILKLKEKIEKIGKPLKDWDVKIYSGIRTGYNEAFIINTKTRDVILDGCKTEKERKLTEEIIKPVLRGRDIGRYHYNWNGLFIIATFPSKNINIEEYPSLKKHLKSFGDRLKQDGGKDQRKKTNNEWFETQSNINYYDEFEKEKIIWQEIVREPKFHYDTKKFYIEATGFIMTGKNLKYICGLLNSKPAAFFFKKFYAGGGLGEDVFRYKKAFLEKLPIPEINNSNRKIVAEIEKLVDKILKLKSQNPSEDTSECEKKIDELVYQLYELTPDEIKIIEENNS